MFISSGLVIYAHFWEFLQFPATRLWAGWEQWQWNVKPRIYNGICGTDSAIYSPVKNFWVDCLVVSGSPLIYSAALLLSLFLLQQNLASGPGGFFTKNSHILYHILCFISERFNLRTFLLMEKTLLDPVEPFHPILSTAHVSLYFFNGCITPVWKIVHLFQSFLDSV